MMSSSLFDRQAGDSSTEMDSAMQLAYQIKELYTMKEIKFKFKNILPFSVLM